MPQQQEGETSKVNTIVRVVASPYPFLPEGYWYKGGAPRELFRRLLHPLSPKLEVRDFDLFRTEDVGDEYDHALALRYLADDYEFGHGVEVVENLPTYFETRDLTVNEVALHNTKLKFTERAEEDLDSHCLRPTRYVCNAAGEPLSQTFCKAARFYSEGLVAGVEWDLLFLTLPKSLRLFDAVLNLDRCYLSGIEVAKRFVTTLKEHDFFLEAPEGIDGLVWFVEEADKQLPMRARIFRNLPREVLTAIDLKQRG